MKILLICSDTSARQTLSDVLPSAGTSEHPVIITSVVNQATTKECLFKKKDAFDLIIMCPGADISQGLSLLSKIRQHEKTKDFPFVMLSNSVPTDTLAEHTFFLHKDAIDVVDRLIDLIKDTQKRLEKNT